MLAGKKLHSNMTTLKWAFQANPPKYACWRAKLPQHTMENNRQGLFTRLSSIFLTLAGKPAKVHLQGYNQSLLHWRVNPPRFINMDVCISKLKVLCWRAKLLQTHYLEYFHFKTEKVLLAGKGSPKHAA